MAADQSILGDTTTEPSDAQGVTGVMQIGVPREESTRLVAATPATTEQLGKLGYRVLVEEGAGQDAGHADAAYQEAGAAIGTASDAWGSDVVIAVDPPQPVHHKWLKPGATLITQMAPAENPDLVQALAQQQVSGLALDAVPRISRAQALDTLSTMSNMSGYRAVIEAAAEYQGMLAGQVTAAGKTKPATVFVIGGGVAGLAAIGTAVSLGANVRAFDVRPEAGEQIESMGATFVQAEAAQQEISSDGYARELTADQEAATAALYAAEAANADIVITTALVRGKAPRTLTNEMIAAMKPGSVIVDLAASGGGNAEATVPGERVVTPNGVIVLGYTDLAARMPAQTSQLYGTNIVNLMKLITPEKDGQAVLDLDDQVVRGMTVAHQGEVLWPPPPVQVSAAAPTPVAAAPAAVAAADPGAAARRSQRWLIIGALAALAIIATMTFSDNMFRSNFTVFALALGVGFFVISEVAASLHTPLMSHTNAISGIVLIGALLQLGNANLAVTILSAIAAILASVNIFGGFFVTRRMVDMFRKEA